MNKVFFILFLFIFPLPAGAQLYDISNKWQAGIIGGVAFNDLTDTRIRDEFGGQTGFTGGSFVEYHFNDLIQLRLELNFERRNLFSNSYSSGLREYDTSTYVCIRCYYQYDITYTNDYLTIPFYFQYTQNQGNFYFGARLGLYYSILMQSWNQGFEELYLDPLGIRPFQISDIEPGLYRLHISGETADVINTYDSGIILGLFSKYDLGPRLTLQVDGSLWLGFAGLFENPAMVIVNNRTYMVRLGLGYKLFME